MLKVFPTEELWAVQVWVEVNESVLGEADTVQLTLGQHDVD